MCEKRRKDWIGVDPPAPFARCSVRRKPARGSSSTSRLSALLEPATPGG
jgi:hypothetical protein